MVRSYFKRRYYRRKSYRKFGRGSRRTRRFTKRISRASKAILHAKRSTLASIGTFTGTAGNGGVVNTNYQFSLNDVSGAADFVNLFEQAKLNCVVIRITPLQNVNQYPATTVTQNIPMFGYTIDYDDVTNVSLSQIQEYGLYKETRFNKPIKIKIMKPKIPMGAYNQASLSYNGAVLAKNQWFRTSDSQIVHYGLKTVIYGVLLNQQISYSVRATYYFTFKYIK